MNKLMGLQLLYIVQSLHMLSEIVANFQKIVACLTLVFVTPRFHQNRLLPFEKREKREAER